MDPTYSYVGFNGIHQIFSDVSNMFQFERVSKKYLIYIFHVLSDNYILLLYIIIIVIIIIIIIINIYIYIYALNIDNI